MDSIDTTHFNTKKLPVNLTSEENVKHLIHKRDDLLNNIHNIELELETAIKNMPHVSTLEQKNNNQFPQEFNNVFKERFEPVNDEIKNKLILWMQEINFIKDMSLTPEMLSQVLQNG